MKKSLSVMALRAIFFACVGLLSCTKAYDTIEEPLVISNAEKEAKLVQKAWVVDVLREKEFGANEVLMFKRGASSNLVDLSLMKFKFNKNYTVMYTDYTGIASSNITWKPLDGFSALQLVNGQNSEILLLLDLSFSNSGMTYKIQDGNAISIYQMIPID